MPLPPRPPRPPRHELYVVVSIPLGDDPYDLLAAALVSLAEDIASTEGWACGEYAQSATGLEIEAYLVDTSTITTPEA